MRLFSQTKALFIKEIQLEWRNRYAFNGILLYVIGAVFVCYLSFNVKRGVVHPITWNALFWIIILFCAINAVSKSFSGEREGRNLYYYTLASPQAIIISKTIYNTLLLLLLGSLAFVFYSLIMGNPVQDLFLFVACIVLCAFSFAGVLTLISAIASKAGSSSTLMAILSFPTILPLLLLIIKISKNAMDGLELTSSYKDLSMLSAITVIIFASSYILYPYIHKS
ncbi:MAG: heme exporter protein CcmB [Cytophagales bacterium]